MIKNMLSMVLQWIFNHKKTVFIYLPAALVVLFTLYTAYVYMSWQGDREAALKKLHNYKSLIDRTEELQDGSYNASEIDLNAKVVDIPTRIYDRNNEIIGEFFEQKREIVPYTAIPKWIVNAVIASEDRDFYRHHGISYRGILRALVSNIVHLRIVQGGSTITQQLSKVLFTDMERNIKRKIYEAFCAAEIEKQYDKQDIMSMYLNLIYFGNGAYGVEAAAKMFFGMSVKKLNETECAMIVGAISNPLIYSPLSNLGNAVNKTRRIMKSMVDAGYIKREIAEYQFRRFLGKWDVKMDKNDRPEKSLIGTFIMSQYRVNRAPLFNEQIRRTLVEKFGEEVVKKGGLSVYTTIDGVKQDIAEKALQAGILDQREYQLKIAEKYRKTKRYEAERDNASSIEGALISLNQQTGEIISYVGGYSFSAQNQMDHVSQIRRQPGSSFKPVIYCAAIQNRDITPSTILVDEETTFVKKYSPKNYDGIYMGKVTARDALSKSINIVAVKILEKTGYTDIMKLLSKSLTLDDEETERRFGRTLSLALGAYEMSPMELCIVHSVIANGGNYINPYGIINVKDYNNNMVWDNAVEVTSAVREKQASLGKLIDPASCAVTLSMLRGVFEEGGTAFYAVKGRKLGFQIAGKTGTSSNYSDAWFAGYTSDLVSVVWVGNRKGAISLGKGRAGGVIAAGIWANYVEKIYRESAPADFAIPDEGIVKQTICLDSGLVPGNESGCTRIARDQLFLSGTEPGEYCSVHVKPQVPAIQ